MNTMHRLWILPVGTVADLLPYQTFLVFRKPG